MNGATKPEDPEDGAADAGTLHPSPSGASEGRLVVIHSARDRGFERLVAPDEPASPEAVQRLLDEAARALGPQDVPTAQE